MVKIKPLESLKKRVKKDPRDPKNIGPFIVLMLLLLGLAFIFSAISPLFSGIFNVEKVSELISGFGIIGPLIMIFVIAIAVVISPIPGLPVIIAGGIIFGPWLGFLYSLIGNTLGAIGAFWIARSVGKETLGRWFRQEIDFGKDIQNRYLFLAILLARLIPLFSFDLVSYGAGLSVISFRNFTIATVLGSTPSILLFSFGGSAIRFGSLTVFVMTFIFLGLVIYLPIIFDRYNILSPIRKKKNNGVQDNVAEIKKQSAGKK